MNASFGGERELRLTAEQKQSVEEAIAAAVAVQVYRQLQAIPGAEDLAAAGGNIAGNCCSCSQAER